MYDTEEEAWIIKNADYFQNLTAFNFLLCVIKQFFLFSQCVFVCVYVCICAHIFRHNQKNPQLFMWKVEEQQASANNADEKSGCH